MKEIGQGYRIVPTRRARKNATEEKSNMSRSLMTKLYRNERNKKIKVSTKLGIQVPNSTR